jgi:hypothetical protein
MLVNAKSSLTVHTVCSTSFLSYVCCLVNKCLSACQSCNNCSYTTQVYKVRGLVFYCYKAQANSLYTVL